MVDVHHIHRLKKLLRGSSVSQREIKACVGQGQARAANDTVFVILMIEIAESKYIHFMPSCFEGAFVQVNIGRDATDIGFVGVRHHSDSHGDMLRQGGVRVKAYEVAMIKSKYDCENDFT